MNKHSYHHGPLARRRVARAIGIFCLLSTIVLLFGSASMPVSAGDWPTWRFDAARGACSPDALPATLHLQWHLELPAPRPAWPPEQLKVQFDGSYEPIVVGHLLVVPSMVHDSVTAYDTRTGEPAWTFYANGPVRFAPLAFDDKICFISDDGYAYCVTAAAGTLVWKMQGQTQRRWLVGNDRVISGWPARGGPVYYDGKIYFTAGIWPFMGTFIHAIDAESGRVVWTNSGTGSDYVVQQHGSPAFAGVAPQGYLAATENVLLVPGGRTVPAGFDRKTGNLLFFEPGSRQFSKGAGGYASIVGNGWYANGGIAYTLGGGKGIAQCDVSLVAPDRMFGLSAGRLNVYAGASASGNAAGKARLTPVARHPAPEGARRLLIRAGHRLYATDGADAICALDVPPAAGQPLSVSWSDKIAGQVYTALAADDRLFVVSRQGDIYCFGGEPTDATLPENKVKTGRTTLIARGAVWKYLDDGSDQGEAWRAADFDDSAWKSGPAELGYGDDDEATVLAFGGKPKRKFITSYFRHAFNLPEGVSAGSLGLTAKVDDGAVFYLNGTDIGHIEMPSGKITYATTAKRARNEETFHPLPVDLKLLQPGRNVLAAEVHQATPGSSDISFDMELTGELIAESTVVDSPNTRPPPADIPAPTTRAAGIVRATGVRDGYCIVLGLADGPFVDELARSTRLRVVAIEPDGQRVEKTRRRLAKAGLLGTRVAVIEGDLASIAPAPMMASLIITSRRDTFGLSAEAFLTRVFQMLRPYGGVALLPSTEGLRTGLETLADRGDMPGAKFEHGTGYSLVTRAGPIPGAGRWTHQNGNVANTLSSTETRARAPLGLLWFGGPSSRQVLPRHGHGPSPQVVGGRLFIEGVDMLRAIDVYTGRLLWQRDLPEFGIYYNITDHQPGAGAIGGNYVSVDDGVYVVYGRKALRLAPDTGKTIATFELPGEAEGAKPYWGYIGVYENLLIGTAGPVAPYSSKQWARGHSATARFAEGSRRLVVMDRHSGKVLWQRTATFNFRHNAIIAGGGKIFCLDHITDVRAAMLKRRGQSPGKPRLLALDAATGKTVWETDENVFGTWLAYSAEHDLLLQAGSSNRDRARDEARKGLAAYRGTSGRIVWETDDPYDGPCMIVGDRIITQTGGNGPGTALSLLDGKPLARKHPLTGRATPWTFTRNYGCNTAIASTNLITFRSAAAGYYDLAGDGGTGNFGGFRSSCTANLIPADGVVSGPEYTRTCECSYPIQSSVALAYMPEVETWTFNPIAPAAGSIRRLGINFGAPGDRRDSNGTLWLEYPAVGGPSPDVPLEVLGTNVRFQRKHSSTVAADAHAWIGASWMRGAEQIRVTLTDDADANPEKYTVRLYFVEDAVPEGDARLFDVAIQGKTVIKDLDVVQQAGGVNRLLVRQFDAVDASVSLTVTLTSRNPDDGNATVLCGIELVVENGASPRLEE